MGSRDTASHPFGWNCCGSRDFVKTRIPFHDHWRNICCYGFFCAYPRKNWIESAYKYLNKKNIGRVAGPHVDPTKQNYFHKPQYSLRDFWVVNDKFYISNISYASIGNGGGTGISGNTNNYDVFGQYNLQDSYNGNIGNTYPISSNSE